MGALEESAVDYHRRFHGALAEMTGALSSFWWWIPFCVPFP